MLPKGRGRAVSQKPKMFYNKLDFVHEYCTFKWCQNNSGNENILGILLMNSYDLQTTPTTEICHLSPLN